MRRCGRRIWRLGADRRGADGERISRLPGRFPAAISTRPGPPTAAAIIFSNIFGAVPGNSPALESLETTFGQDLNGDGVIGLPTKVIQTDTSSYGTTSLAEIGNQLFSLRAAADLLPS